MLIAVLLAISIHMVFMNFEFTPAPISVPEVSLPRSVSVFLGQKHVVEKAELQKTNTQTAKSLIDNKAAEIEPEKYIQPEPTAVVKKKDNTTQRPVLPEKTFKQPVDIAEEKSTPAAEITPVNQRVENIKTEANAAIQKSATTDEPQTVQKKNNGVIQPGTLQMAYPRYQVNAPPPYPALARKRGMEGTVILQVLVNREGGVDDLKIDHSSSYSLLDRAAVKAVRKWSFEPGKKGEERVSMWVKVPVTFKLKK